MNISSQTISGSCENKCFYEINYNSSGSTVANKGTELTLTYDDTTSPVPQAKYNTNGYKVSEISIVSPSLHLYNGKHSDAEIFISHKSNSSDPALSSNSLIVCVPISKGGKNGPGVQIVSNIVDLTSKSAPAKGQVVSGLQPFTLNDIIPKATYYSYDQSALTTIVAFEINSAVYISPDDLSTLRKITNPYPDNIFPGGFPLFISLAPVATVGDGSSESGDIYIDCQPTGVSDDTTDVVSGYKHPEVAPSNYDLSHIFSGTSFIGIVFVLMTICIIFVVHFLLSTR